MDMGKIADILDQDDRRLLANDVADIEALPLIIQELSENDLRRDPYAQ